MGVRQRWWTLRLLDDNYGLTFIMSIKYDVKIGYLLIWLCTSFKNGVGDIHSLQNIGSYQLCLHEVKWTYVFHTRNEYIKQKTGNWCSQNSVPNWRTDMTVQRRCSRFGSQCKKKSSVHLLQNASDSMPILQFGWRIERMIKLHNEETLLQSKVFQYHTK